jgi:hypothetical protein
VSWVSEGDRDCRYVAEHPSNGAFTRLLQAFEIRLPSGVTVQDLVGWGWVVPVLRVEIPAPYLESWDHFPELGITRQIRAEDRWVDELWHRSFVHFPEHPAVPWDAEWFVHRLDRASDPLAQEVRAHALPTAQDAALPGLVKLPSGQKVQAWLDYFTVWQALQVFDVLDVAPLHAPLLNTPTARQAARGLLKHLDTMRQIADMNLRRVTARWDAARPVLEWVYQYRTLLGIWLGRHGRAARIRSGARALAARLGLGADELRDGIRDVLLVLWRDLDRADLPPKTREHLRQDVYWATEFLSHLTGRDVDPYDQYWNPPDRNARRWERLRHVLPFELREARHDLPHLASHYLKRYHSLASPRRRYEKARIRDLTERWWPQSYAFRRFCLAFLRLHRHYGGAVNREHRIQLTAETPIDFLLLLTLAVEKLQAERFLVAAGGPAQLPYFNTLVLDRAGAVGKAWGLPSLRSLVKIGMDTQTKLFDLTLTGRNPFRPARKASLTRYLADTFVTFAKLRNYAAHHDKLDQELIHTKTGAVALESLLLVTFLTLDP